MGRFLTIGFAVLAVLAASAQTPAVAPPSGFVTLSHLDPAANGAAFVSFGPLPGGASCEGFLSARDLRNDWYDLNEQRTALVGRDTGNSVGIGDPVSVKVTRVEAVRGRVDLEPVSN